MDLDDPSYTRPDPAGLKVTCLGQAVIFLFVLGCVAGAYYLFMGGDDITFPPVTPALSTNGSSTPATTPSVTPAPLRPSHPPQAEIGIAYGTEKKRWLHWAADEFAKTPDGQRIRVKLIPMGSLEGAQAFLKGDKRLHVWSPASSLYRDVFETEWEIRHSGKPIIAERELAITPMIFCWWKPRYEAFVAKYGEVSFTTIARALREPGGWDSIAGKPEWGVFKFGHTHPTESNSGLSALVLEAYHFHGKRRGLVLQDILNPAFNEWMVRLERGVSGQLNSTGTMMRAMVLRGPGSYDCLFVYENLAIDYFKNAQGRWGDLYAVYPKENIWNENPYYIIDAPWSTADQRAAAAVFLEFLMSEPIQQQALLHGFRPGNTDVPIIAPDSPFMVHRKDGIRVDIGEPVEPPKAAVLTNLLEIWQRNLGGAR